jgi:hypothetical protein
MPPHSAGSDHWVAAPLGVAATGGGNAPDGGGVVDGGVDGGVGGGGVVAGGGVGAGGAAGGGGLAGGAAGGGAVTGGGAAPVGADSGPLPPEQAASSPSAMAPRATRACTRRSEAARPNKVAAITVDIPSKEDDRIVETPARADRRQVTSHATHANG